MDDGRSPSSIALAAERTERPRPELFFGMALATFSERPAKEAITALSAETPETVVGSFSKLPRNRGLPAPLSCSCATLLIPQRIKDIPTWTGRLLRGIV